MTSVTSAPPVRQGLVPLGNGRSLAWSQWGDPSSRPVLFCTGAGMSGSMGFAEKDLEALELCLIAIDRPGLGRSTPDPEATLGTWSSDVARLVEVLNLHHPLALGFSQGGPFALQLGAAGIVEAVALVAGQDDFNCEAVAEKLAPPVKEMLTQLRNDRQGFEAYIAQSANAEWLWSMIMSMSSEADKRVYVSESFASRYRLALEEGFSRGASGYARDLLNTWSPWPFQLEDLNVPVDIWYGTLDTSPVHSPDFGATMARRIPRARRWLVEDEGSSVLWTIGSQIIGALGSHRYV